jgi:hypothetical protein
VATVRFMIAQISMMVVATSIAIVVVVAMVSIIINTMVSLKEVVNFDLGLDGIIVVSTKVCLITIKELIAIEAS